MPTQVQFRRGTAAQNDNFTGAVGEISINTSNNTIRVHNGSTAGGFELSRKADLTTANVTELTNLYFTATRAINSLSGNTVSIGDLTVTGNLFVEGTTTDISTTNLVVDDKNIIIANGATNPSQADGAGITIDGAELELMYVASGDYLSLNKQFQINGSPALTTANTTTHLNEGTNLYYSNARVYANVVVDFGAAANTYVNTRLNTKANIADLTTNNVTEGTNLYFTATRAINSLSGNTVSIGDLTVTGNLLVEGSTTEISTTSLVVEDKNIVLADGAANAAAADGAGITIDGANATFTYTNSDDSWSLNKSLTLSGNIIPLSDNTYDLGSATNRFKDLYLTGNSLILGNITLKEQGGGLQVVNSDTDEVVFTASNASGVTSVAGAIGDVSNAQILSGVVQAQIDTDDVLESVGNLYYTNARVYANVVVDFGAVSNSYVNTRLLTKANVADLNTSNVTEGSNLYFNTQRARDSISVTGSGSYDNSTGIITVTGGVTEVAGASGVVSNAQLLAGIVQAQIDTDDVLESAGNLYFTQQRARDSISVTGSGSYDNATGVITVTGGVVSVNGETGTVVLTTANIAEQSNLYYTDARVYSNVVNLGFYNKANIADLNTSNVAEGTNLYFTNARSRAAISAGTGVNYDNSTGIISIGQSVGTADDVTFSNVVITGNLLVQGNSIQFTSNTLLIEDPLIQLGINPVGDTVDLGFFGHYFDGTVERHTGLFRDATDGQFKLFANLFPEPDTIVNTEDASYQSANLVLNFVVGKVTDISNHSTTNLSEGTNLYFNNTRARSAISQGSGITYTTSTGVISANVTSVAGQTGAISNNQLLSAILAVDGSGSTLDADLLDGLGGGGAGAYALKANNLSVFASTTSAQLADVISDETGTGNLVFNASPTFTGTPLAPTAAIGTANTMIATTAFASNATNLASGVVAPARVVGSYTSITGLGTITTGVWQGSSISTVYTDAKITSVAGQTGAISNNQLLSAILAVDGVGSTLDADLLDGLGGGGAGAYALKANNLSVFAATTSAELAGVISDETGSGSLVFATSPTLTTPRLAHANVTYPALVFNANIFTGFYAESANIISASVSGTKRANIDANGISVIGNVTVSSNVTTGNITVLNNSRVGNVTSGTWFGSSIGTAYTDAKVTNITATTPILANVAVGSVGLSHATSGVSATTYGNATNIPVFTVNATGHITSASNVSISSGGLTVANTGVSNTHYVVLTTSTSGSISSANISETKLSFVPSTGVLSATDFNSLSDFTLKENIEPISNSFDIISNLNPVKFNWKDTKNKTFGLIAQDLEKILPNLVNTNDSGLKSVSYIPLISILINCVKDLKKEIDELKSGKR